MNTEPFVIERVLNAPVQVVWEALTDKAKMKDWYFDMPSFKPEIGAEFSFTGGTEEKQYLHICKVTEVIANQKLAYSWRYEGYPGISHVSFELFEEGSQTRLKLTHEGLESFSKDDPNFARESFAAGWTYIIGTSIKNYIDIQR